MLSRTGVLFKVREERKMDREELAAKRQAGQEEDRYSVARFVEKHWVALIGILTAGVAVISAVINFMAYMSQYLYLKQWNVNDWFLAKAELGPHALLCADSVLLLRQRYFGRSGHEQGVHGALHEPGPADPALSQSLPEKTAAGG